MVLFFLLGLGAFAMLRGGSQLDDMVLEIEGITATYADDVGTVHLTADMLDYENSKLRELLGAMNDDSQVTIDGRLYNPQTLSDQIGATDGLINRLKGNNEMLVVTKTGESSFYKIN